MGRELPERVSESQVPAAGPAGELRRRERWGVEAAERGPGRVQDVHHHRPDHLRSTTQTVRPSAWPHVSSHRATRSHRSRTDSPPCGAALGSASRRATASGSAVLTSSSVRPRHRPTSRPASSVSSEAVRPSAVAVSRQRAPGEARKRPAAAGSRPPLRPVPLRRRRASRRRRTGPVAGRGGRRRGEGDTAGHAVGPPAFAVRLPKDGTKVRPPVTRPAPAPGRIRSACSHRRDSVETS